MGKMKFEASCFNGRWGGLCFTVAKNVAGGGQDCNRMGKSLNEIILLRFYDFEQDCVAVRAIAANLAWKATQHTLPGGVFLISIGMVTDFFPYKKWIWKFQPRAAMYKASLILAAGNSPADFCFRPPPVHPVQWSWMMVTHVALLLANTWNERLGH